MRYVYDFDEDSGGGRELLGGKGIGLAEMTALGVPVPAGFTITTDACRAYMASGGELPDGLEAEVAEHIASANLTYAAVVGPADVRRKWEFDPAPSIDWLFTKLDSSLAVSREVLEGVTAENLTESRENDWCPNCEEQLIQGPLDALWFAMQMVRHTAYHLGQLNLYLRLLEADGRE